MYTHTVFAIPFRLHCDLIFLPDLLVSYFNNNQTDYLKMHAIQGAMAVRRAREKRETRRSSQKQNRLDGDGDGESQLSLEFVDKAPKTESCMTAFHLGVVFILLGFLMVFSSMISGSVKESDWSQLLGVGATFIIVGLVMVMVNRIITEKEEEELTRYVHHRLARSRSGHALVRCTESTHELGHHGHGSGSSRPQRAKSVRNGKGARKGGSKGGSFVKLKVSGKKKSLQPHGGSVISIQNGNPPPLVKSTTEVASAAGGFIATCTETTTFTVENENCSVPAEEVEEASNNGIKRGGDVSKAPSERIQPDSSNSDRGTADESEKLLSKSESCTSAKIVANLVESKHHCSSSSSTRKSSKRRSHQQETTSSSSGAASSGIVTTSSTRTVRTTATSNTPGGATSAGEISSREQVIPR